MRWTLTAPFFTLTSASEPFEWTNSNGGDFATGRYCPVEQGVVLGDLLAGLQCFDVFQKCAEPADHAAGGEAQSLPADV